MSRDDTINMEHYEILSLAHKICNECQKLSKRCPGGLCGNAVRKAKEIYYNQLAEKVRVDQMREKQIEELTNELVFTSNYGTYNAVAIYLVNKGYRKQSEWISVEERLPSEEEYRDEYGELIPILVCEKDTQYPYRAMYDGTEWGDGLMKIRGITHWMPLPEAPKMKGGGE